MDYNQNPSDIEAKFKILQTTNFNLRTEMEKLKKENTAVKNAFSQQKEKLQKVSDEKCRLEQEAKFAHGNSNSKHLKAKCENLEKENASLIQKNFQHSLSTAKDKKCIENLKEKVDQKNDELSEKNDELSEKNDELSEKNDELREEIIKVAELKKKFESKSDELNALKKQYSDTLFLLENAETKSSDYESKYCYFMTLSEMQDNQITELEETRDTLKTEVKVAGEERNKAKQEICSLQKELEQSKLDLQQANATISEQIQELCKYQTKIEEQSQNKEDWSEENKLLKSRVDKLEKKKDCHLEIIELQNKKITEQGEKLLEAKDVMLQQDNIIKESQNLEARMNEALNDKVTLEVADKQKKEEIELLKTKHDKNLKCVNRIKDCLKSVGNEEKQFSAKQFEMLVELIREKMGEHDRLVGVKRRKLQDDASVVHISKVTEHSFLQSTPRQSSSSSSSAESSLPSSSNSTTSSSAFSPSRHDKVVDGNADQLLHIEENLKNVTALKKIANTSPKTVVKHAEDVSRRLPGRGKENIGAKYYCNCNYVCTTLSALEHHIKYATQKKKFDCHLCSKRFLQRKELKRHMKSSHSELNTLEIYKNVIECEASPAVLSSLEQQQSCTNSDRQADEDIVTVQEAESHPCSPEKSKNTVNENGNSIDTNTTAKHLPSTCMLPMENDGIRDECPMQIISTMCTDTATVISYKPSPIVTPRSVSSSVIVKSFLKEHGIDPDNTNKCLCGIPYGSSEALAKHIELRKRR